MPNITGELGPFRMWAIKAEPQIGALSIRQRGLTGWAKAEGDISADILFNASKSSSLYKQQNSIQVTSLRLNNIVRI